MYRFSLEVSPEIRLHLLQIQDAPALFNLIDSNREHLRRWLPWVDGNKTQKSSEEFIQLLLGQFSRNETITAGIYYKQELCGIAGFHKINHANKVGSMGYWLGQGFEGKGIMSQSVAFLTELAFETWTLNRLEIRCATDNLKSQAIPERLGFTCDGISRQCEIVNGRVLDHKVYAKLRG